MTMDYGNVFFRNQQVLKDSHLGKDDILVNADIAYQTFVEGKAAMFHGYPALMQQLQTQMDAKLICIPYFSQTSEEAFVYMTPSLNIAFNKDLEKIRKSWRLHWMCWIA